MFILKEKIAEKYIIELGKKKVLNHVKYNEASSSIKQAIDEAAALAKKSIESAVEPLKAKIAQKDEFIASQTTLNSTLQSQNEDLKQANTFLKSEIEEKNSQNSLLQSTLEKYHPIMKEAYKQGITPEIREQKAGISDILTSLLQHKSKTVEQNIETPVTKEIIQAPQNILETSKTESKPLEHTKQNAIPRRKTTKTAQKNSVNVKSEPISKEILAKIENERKNQVLDKERIVTASVFIKKLEEGLKAHPKSNNSPHDYYWKVDINKLIENQNCISAKKDWFVTGEYNFGYAYDSSMSGTYIMFFDENNKKLLSTKFGDEAYTHTIFDKNGVPMVGIATKNGVIEALAVDFNKVKRIPEILYDKGMNEYAQNAINQAKEGTTSTFKDDGHGSGYNNYYNSDGALAVREYIFDLRRKDAKRTSILNFENGKTVKSFDNDESGFDYINKYSNNGDKEFSIMFFPDYEGKLGGNWASMDLKEYKQSSNRFRDYVYSKTNYGLVSHPVTKDFMLFDLSEHNMKPWDLINLNILKPYLK